MKKNGKLPKANPPHLAESKVGRRSKKTTIDSTAAVDIQGILHELESQNRELKQARAEVAEAYRQYTDLYDFAPVGYFTMARNGTIHQINLAGANLLGVDHNEAEQLHLAAFVFSDSHLAFQAFFQRLLSGEGKETCELLFEKKGNEPFWVRLEATCFEGGDVCRAMLADITERKQMEQALQESEKRFRMLLQDVSTIAVQGYAIDGTTQYWNTASEKLYGYSTQEAIGKSLLDLIIPPEMRNDVWHAIQQMAETGQPIPAAELSLMRKDGSRVPVYSSHAIVSVPGRALELFCLDIDLTERKRATALLQARVRISEFADSHSLDELLQKALDEAELLTGSKIGFAHFLETDQKTLKLQAWSTNTLQNMCTAEGKGSHYSVDQAGVWVECIAARAPVIHNDYASLPSSRRKGLPSGHAPVVRELVVPVLHNDLIVMILGMGNKPTDYDDKDVETLSQLANLTWDVVQRKQAEELLKESEWRTRIVSELTTDYIFVVDVDPVGILKFHWASENLFRITGRTVEEVSTSDRWENIIHPNDRVRFFGFIKQILSTAETGELECRTFYKHGGERWIRIFARPQVGEGNSVTTIVGAIQDITERKRAEEGQREASSYNRRLIEASIDPLVTIGPDGKITDLNEATEIVTGLTREQLVGEDFLNYFTEPDKAREGYQKALAEGIVKDYPLTIRHISGKTTDVLYNAAVYKNEAGEVQGVFAAARDITERVRTEQALEATNIELQAALSRERQLAHTDALTGINNRRRLYELAEHEFEIAARYQQPLSVLMFDLDRFKEVNDTFGHTVGDRILQRVAQVACGELRSADVIGRYGGEEFVIVLPMTRAQQAYPLAERIRMGVMALRVATEKGDAFVTLSIGIVEMLHSPQTDSAEDLIRRADEAMYAAKQAGRNRTQIGNL